VPEFLPVFCLLEEFRSLFNLVRKAYVVSASSLATAGYLFSHKSLAHFCPLEDVATPLRMKAGRLRLKCMLRNEIFFFFKHVQDPKKYSSEKKILLVRKWR
jgi:hypothetical protein